MQKSLLLFITLLCTLTISVYFGVSVQNSDSSLNVSEYFKEGIDGATTGNTSSSSSSPSPTSSAAEQADDININVSFPADVLNGLFTDMNKNAPPFPMTGVPQMPMTGVPQIPMTGVPQNPMSDYYNWLTFWNTVAHSKEQQTMLQSSNYVPKTAMSVVPPTCSQCQSNHGSVCVGCGGLGGNGSTSTYKNKFSDFLSSNGGGYKGNGNWGGYGNWGGNGNGQKTTTTDSESETTGLLKDAGAGAVDLTKTVLNDATGLAAGAGSGAVGLLKDTGSGAVGLLKDTGSGAVGLLKDAGSGVASVLKSNPVQLSNPQGNNNGQNNSQQQQQSGNNVNPYQSGYYSQGPYNLPNSPLGINGIDPYSYNGALISKGSNYIPVTNDFSSFRK